MVSVTPTTLWLSDAAAPSVGFPLPLAAISWTPSKRGEVKTYGAGRRRLVTRKGTSSTASVDLSFCDRATVQQIEAWVGRLLLLRDPMGRKVYGVYLDADVSEIDGDADGATVSLTFTEVTYSEAV